MAFNADAARNQSREFHIKNPPQPQPSKEEEIKKMIQETIQSLSQSIEVAARNGGHAVTSYLVTYSPEPHGRIFPRGILGGTKHPSGFEKNPKYLNEANKRIWNHFASLGFSVSLEAFGDGSDSLPVIGFVVRW